MNIYSTSGEDDSTITYSKRGKHFSGYVFFTDLNGEFINGWLYNDGIITKQSKRELLHTNTASKALPPDQDCENIEIQWYEQDCFYYTDGSSECTDWYYIGSTYETECTDGGGGGGSVGPPDDTEYEYAVNKQKTWTVALNNYGLWTVISTEQFAGILKSSEPQGGHFTGSSHLTSSIINNVPAPNNFTWTEFGATTNASGQSANSTISGKVTTSDRIDIPISKTNSWTFSSVFP